MKRSFSVALFLILAVGAAFAQAGFGGLSGTVTDATQAVMPNATVTLTGNNGEIRTTRTNGAGDYLFTTLPVGSGYEITVSAPKFTTAKVTGLSTSVGTTLTQNVTLAVGSESQTVEVSAASVEQVQTETSAISQLIDNTIFRDSPLDVRTQNQFVFLVAGAASGQVTNRSPAVDGARSGAGNYLLEGMDNNDQDQAGAGSTYGIAGAVTTISPDAIQEYRVITHNPPAEYGRAGGFATDTVLKSGTQHFHGSLFEYNRIQALAAEHWFSNYAGLHDNLIRNQFGGSVGGPVYRDRTFFFASAEFQRVRTGTPVIGTGTTQAFLDFVNTGAFETFQETNANGLCMVANGRPCPGAFSGSHTLGPIFKSLMAAEPRAFPLGKTLNATGASQGLYTCPAPNCFGITYPVPLFAQVGETQSAPVNQNRASMKIDHRLTNKDQLSFTYLADLVDNTIGFGGGGTTFGPDLVRLGDAQLFTGSWTHTFSPSLQNLFRLGYTRHVANRSVPDAQGVPQIVTAASDGLTAGFGASSGLPQFFTDNEFLYEDSVTKDVAHHSLKVGFRYMRTRNGSSYSTDVNGRIYPWDTESLLTDETFDDQADRAIPSSVGGGPYGSIEEAFAAVDTTNNLAPNPYRGYRANELAVYVQDDWRVTSQLVLNLGVRWEYFGPPHNFQAGLDSNVFFGPFTLPTANGNPFLPNTTFVGAMQGANFQVVPNATRSTLWKRDLNNLAPRVGFAFDPMGRGKFVVRGGFGVGFDRLYNNIYENIRFNSPHYSDNGFGYLVNLVPAGPLEQPALTNIPFTANNLFASYGGLPVPRHVDENLVTAYYEQANLGVEYEMAKGYVAEVNYIGTFGRKLVGLKDANSYDGRTACTSVSGLQKARCIAAGYPRGFTSARPTALFASDNFRTNGFNSNYDGLQVSVRKSYSHGLMFLANYSYGKAMDDLSDLLAPKTGEPGTADSQNPGYDYGPADFDVKHMASITLNYESQWRKRSLLFGGWGLSPILTFQSGSPFSVADSFANYDPNKDGRLGDRPVYIGTGTYKSAIFHNVRPTGHPYLTASQFQSYTCPATVNMGLWCNPPMSRNAFYGPGYWNADVAVSKRVYVTESQHLTAQVAFFNALNHPQFLNPSSDIANPQTFGVSQFTMDPRTTQLSLRYEF